MRGFRIKPNLKAMDFGLIKPEQIDYICSTQVLDKIICKRKDIVWDQELADLMDEKYQMFFVVKTNMEYNVVSSEILTPYLEKNAIAFGSKVTDKGKKCIEHYLKALR
jgi:predicted nucleic acid-binding protein